MNNLLLLLGFCLLCSPSLTAQEESDYYVIEQVKIPGDVLLEVGGMDIFEDGRLAVCTRRGEVYIISNSGPDASYQLFARGLHEPLGIGIKDGDIYVTQRGEVTRLHDRDGNGKADVYMTVYQIPLTGNYHEYHYGPLWQADGSFLTTLNVGWEGKGVSKAKWRGWMMKYHRGSDRLIPFAVGMRSPAGMGLDKDGEIFVAENQGDWIGSGRITHVEEGDFLGHPAGLAWTGEPGSPLDLKVDDITDEYQTMVAARAAHPEVKLPAVWFPHGILGVSTAAILNESTGGKFGPFQDQLLVCDQGQSKIMRVALEKVEGEFQGAVFPFREGFGSGTLRMNFAADGALYIGGTGRGWGSTGGKPFSLERLRWTGRTPFEMKTIRARTDGFDVEFTQPVAKNLAPASFALQNFTYLYHHNYGSPVVDIESNPINSVKILPDGKTVRLTVDGLRPGYIYELRASSVRSAEGTKLLHDYGYYTLNNIPGGGDNVAETGSLEAEMTSPKRPAEMPAAWNGRVDAELRIETAPGMKFRQTYLTVKAGAKVRLTLANPDDMQHNFVLTAGKLGDRVGQAAGELGISGPARDHIPEIDAVLYHTQLVEPSGEDTIYFTAPTRKGVYEYVCTVPGHYLMMRGVLVVE